MKLLFRASHGLPTCLRGRRPPTLQRRLLVLTAGSVMVTVLVLTAAFLMTTYHIYRQDVQEEKEAMLEALAEMLDIPLEQKNYPMVVDLIDGIAWDDNVKAVWITDREGRVIASSGEGRVARGGRNLIEDQGHQSMMLAGGEHLHLIENVSVVRTIMQRTLLWSALASLPLQAVCLFVAARVSRRLAQPLQEAVVAARRVADGYYDVCLPASGIAETDALGVSLREMGQRLKSLTGNLERKVAERTTQLAQANKDLTWEIIERMRASTQLRESEVRHRALFEASSDAIFVLDQGRAVECNAAGLRLFGVEGKDQMIGRSAEDFSPPTQPDGTDSRVGAERAFAKAFEKGSYQLEWMFHRLDGEEFPGDVWLTAFELDGRPHIQVTIRDISERKRLEQALRESEALYRGVVDNVGIGVTVLSPDMRVMAVNAKIREWVPGVDPAGGQLCYRIFNDPPREEVCSYCPVRQVLADGEAHEAVTETPAANSIRHYRIIATPLKDQAGRVTAVVEMVEDITDRKQAETELEATHRQLLEVSRRAGVAEVATSVLHSAGNVLTSVNVAASVMAERLSESQVSRVGRVAELLRTHASDLGHFLTADDRGRQVPEYLERLSECLAAENAGMLKELDSLMSHIQHIKSIVSMQLSYAGTSEVIGSFALTEVAESALKLSAGSFERDHIEVVREYEDIQPITGDRLKTLLIVVNLVRNAKQAICEGGMGERRLTVRVRRGEGGAALEVADTGIGISPENMQRLFTHGFTTREEGHGLGLHSSALAAREMGGSLTAHSAGEGRGSTFTLELPMQPQRKHA